MTFKKYTVKVGDTLGDIIDKFYGGFTLAHLESVVKENNIANPNCINAGVELRLPGNWEPEMRVANESSAIITQLVTKSEIGKTPTLSVPVADPSEIIKTLPQGDYWQQVFPKDLIIFHFTAGYSWASACATFLQPGRVATAFIIDNVGPKHIVKLFDEKYWSYHLGIKGRYNNNWHNDKRSVAMEIVNIGPVWNKDGAWHDYTGKTWSENDIVKGQNRDAQGGVKFPVDQIDAVCDLANWVADKYKIPRLVPKDKMSCQVAKLAGFKGFATHQMFRADKYDVGIAFDWQTVIEKCKLKEINL